MIFPLFITAQNQESILKASRRGNSTFYKGQSRVLFLTTHTIKDLQTVFPGTDKTCEYILRYYFYTEIHLNKKLDSSKRLFRPSIVMPKGSEKL